jgi:hypothetical protein
MLAVDVAPDLGEVGTARFATRYEDLSQDGHVKLTVLAAALGRACFAQVWAKHPLSGIHRDGVLPILGRLVLEIEPLASRLLGTLEGRGRITLAHERDEHERVHALFLNTTADVFASPQRGHVSASGDPHKLVRVGRAFGEHIFTRPHAPKAERKVLGFNVPGYPAVPAERYKRPKLTQTIAVPDRARALEDAWAPDPCPWVFGMSHTDSNQHVNSLVYVRMFEDAAIRRFAQLGRNSAVLAHKVEIQYRKPCFAGEQLTCMLQAYESPAGDGVVGYLGSEGSPIERAHCAVRMQFGGERGHSRDSSQH